MKAISCAIFAFALGCGGSDDHPRQCIPGDAGMPGFVCSPDGQWETAETQNRCTPGSVSGEYTCADNGYWYSNTAPATTTTQTTAPATPVPNSCQLPAGDYMITYTVVSDPCGLGELPAELVTIGASGRSVGALAAPDGCHDTQQPPDGCTLGLNRDCALTVQGTPVQLHVAIALDLQRGSGTVSLRASAAGEICYSAQTAAVQRL
jgi:hypothetical protein